MVMMVSSGLKVRLASLYGWVMRTHLVHAGHQLDQPRIDLAAADHAQHDARRAGRSVHVHSEFDELRDHRFDFGVARPLFHDNNHDYSASVFVPSAFSASPLRFEALNAARLVHDAFVQPGDGVAVERPVQRCVHLPTCAITAASRAGS